MSKILKDGRMVTLHKAQIKKSEELKPFLDLHLQDTVQIGEPPSYERTNRMADIWSRKIGKPISTPGTLTTSQPLELQPKARNKGKGKGQSKDRKVVTAYNGLPGVYVRVGFVQFQTRFRHKRKRKRSKSITLAIPYPEKELGR